MLVLAATLIGATLVSEDAACLAAGALIARRDLNASLAIAACTFGIFAGDMGLWVLGRAGGRILTWKWLARRVSATRLDEARLWLEQHAGRAIMLSRFTPGARLPVYVVSGLLRISPLRFAAWTLCASLVWTPVVVLAAAQAANVVGQRLALFLPPQSRLRSL
jgi:membrane protein DedA with SNARE-associated domain